MTDKDSTPGIALDLPDVRCATPIAVVADLHLDVGAVDGGAEFVGWLAGLRGVGTLAILGDLFDAWVGPAQARMPGAPAVLDALAALRARGVDVLIVHGNRDFLLDASFERATGARVLRDGFATDTGGQRVVLVHGDTLCTLDTSYQRLRRVVRSRPVTWLAPRLPLFVGAALARRLRRASVRAVAAKPAAEKSVQRDAAEALAQTSRATLLVCGHVHAFRDETLASGARWIVLDAFGGQRDALVLGPRSLATVSSRALRERDCTSLLVP